MSMLRLCFLLLGVVWMMVVYGENDCERIHKAWHLTTEGEKDLYISALHELNRQGKLAMFSTTHRFATDSEQSHYSAAFFAWHRYFIWEFENQVRSLGPEYACFATPYWDITHDAGQSNGTSNISYIFRSGIGGIGDINNDLCVDTQNNGAWSRENYPLKHVCHGEEDSADNFKNGCCLKRRSNGEGSDVSGISSYVYFIKSFKNFGPMHGFREHTFMKYHGEAHGYVGGSLSDYTQMISRYSPEDPTFWLLHTWLDYIFEVWKNCWGYHRIDAQVLQNYLDAYDPFPVNQGGQPNSELDTVLKYIPMNDVDWWRGTEMNPTPRKMWNPKDWNFQFERGTFIRNSHLTALCQNIEWDPDVLLENSVQTQRIIDLQSGGNDVTNVELYEAEVWDALVTMMEDEEDEDEYTEMDVLQTWESKTCNFQRQEMGKNPCYIPIEYEKCNEDDQERSNEITIDELLEKEGVSGNECLEDVRIKMYGYAKSMGMLYELCNGDFDALHSCTVPTIDLMIDGVDDHGYYAKMSAIKQRMEREGRLDENGHGIVSDVIIDGFAEGFDGELDNVEGGQPMYQYVGFDVLVYCVIGVIIFGLVFVLLMRKCFGKVVHDGNEDEDGNMKRKDVDRMSLYGSVYQMI